MAEMSTLTVGDQEYEVVDASARASLSGKAASGHTHTFSNITDAVIGEAANVLGVSSLTGGTPIADGSDLNDFKTVGNYYSAGAAVSGTLLNTPLTASAFMLKVLNGYNNGTSAASANYLIQEIASSSAVARFTRAYQNGSWTEWYRDFNGFTTIPIENGGTNGETITEAANNLSVCSLVGGAAIPSGSDLNNYRTAGNYRTESASISATVSNTPFTAAAFNLFVMLPYSKAANDSSNYTKQVLMPSSNASYFFMRSYTPSSDTWSAWFKYAGTEV